MCHGEVNCNPPPERESHDIGLVHLEVIQQPGKVLGVRVKPVGSERAPIAADVVADDAKVLGKSGELIVPHAAVQLTAVNQYNGRPGSLDFIEKACLPNGGEPMPTVTGG